MTLAYYYTGHSLGLAGTIAVVVALVLRLAWMYRRRRR
jgi:uncharacterized membrane protein